MSNRRRGSFSGVPHYAGGVDAGPVQGGGGSSTFLDVTVLTQGTETASTSSWPTASVSANTNDMLILAVSYVRGGSVNPIIAAPTASGLTWTQLVSDNYDSTGVGRKASGVWYARCDAPFTGTITINAGASLTNNASVWQVIRVRNALTTGVNGANFFAQNVGVVASTSPADVTLAAFSDADNVGLLVLMAQPNVVTGMSVDAGWTMVSEQTNIVNFTTYIGCFRGSSADTVASVSNDGSANLARYLGLELVQL